MQPFISKIINGKAIGLTNMYEKELREKLRCSCGDRRPNDGIIHCYNNHPCYVAKVAPYQTSWDWEKDFDDTFDFLIKSEKAIIYASRRNIKGWISKALRKAYLEGKNDI